MVLSAPALRHLAVHDLLGQALGDGGLAHAGLAHVQRIVLAPAAQHLDGALHLAAAPDQRIDLAHPRLFVEVDAEHVERALFSGSALLAVLLGGGKLVLALARHLGNAVRHVVHHVEAADVLLVQEIHGVRFLLAENGDQDIGAGDFLLAHALDVQHRALDHALETDGRLGVDLAARGELGHVFLEEGAQAAAQFLDVAAAGAQHARGGGIVEQRRQQMLHGDELMALFTRALERAVQ
jgi:hypothetical protein